MRLIKIEHERCGEWEATHYYYTPEEWSHSQIHARLEEARTAYMTLPVKEGRRSLSYREILKANGFIPLSEYINVETHIVSWGHYHGQVFTY